MTTQYLIFTDRNHLELLGVLNENLDLIEKCPSPCEDYWLDNMLQRMKDGVYTAAAAKLPVVENVTSEAGRLVGREWTLGDLLAPAGSKPQTAPRAGKRKTLRRGKAWWLRQAPTIRKLRAAGKPDGVIAEALGMTKKVLAANIARHSLLTCEL